MVAAIVAGTAGMTLRLLTACVLIAIVVTSLVVIYWKLTRVRRGYRRAERAFHRARRARRKA